MEKLLWVGAPVFADSLRDCGWSDIHVRPEPNPGASWESLTREAGFEPDVLIAAAGDMPPLTGMEDFPCLTVFYSADFRPWHIAYAQGFDAAIVSGFDRMPEFYAGMLHPDNVWWSPPYASRFSDSTSPRQWNCLLVEDENSGRAVGDFGKSMETALPGLRRGSLDANGHLAEIIVLHSEKNELDSSVFEAMASGACVVAPRVRDGLGKLFVDGEQLVAYAPGDAGDALYRIRFLLERPQLREHIAASGLGKIDASHRAIHRAMALTDHLCDLWMQAGENATRPRRTGAEDIRQIFLNDVYRQFSQTTANEGLRSVFASASG